MIDHQLVSNRMNTIYERACFKDFNSPRCMFFRYEFDAYNSYINQYSNSTNTQTYTRHVRTPPQKDSDSKRRSHPKRQSGHRE